MFVPGSSTLVPAYLVRFSSRSSHDGRQSINQGLGPNWAVQVMSGLPPVATAGRTSRFGSFVPMHEVAALQPAAREQEPRGR